MLYCASNEDLSPTDAGALFVCNHSSRDCLAVINQVSLFESFSMKLLMGDTFYTNQYFCKFASILQDFKQEGFRR